MHTISYGNEWAILPHDIYMILDKYESHTGFMSTPAKANDE